MNKNKRSHGEQMATRGEVHALYKIIVVIKKEITKLEIIMKKDDKKESKNVK